MSWGITLSARLTLIPEEILKNLLEISTSLENNFKCYHAFVHKVIFEKPNGLICQHNCINMWGKKTQHTVCLSL